MPRNKRDKISQRSLKPRFQRRGSNAEFQRRGSEVDLNLSIESLVPPFIRLEMEAICGELLPNSCFGVALCCRVTIPVNTELTGLDSKFPASSRTILSWHGEEIFPGWLLSQPIPS